jgi:hypothetical protein
MAIDWTMLFKKYRGMWVGLREDNKTVVAFGGSVAEVMDKAKKKKFEHPVLFRVPDKIIPFVGGFRL